MSYLRDLFSRNRPLSYEREFADALKRTHSWLLSPPEFTSTPRRYLNEDATRDILRCFGDVYKGQRPEAFAGKCLDVALRMRGPLEAILDVPMAFTLGYVRFEGTLVFHTPTKNLKPMLKQNLANQAVKLHAWFTLPIHEIIDLTLLTSLGVDQQIPDYIGTAYLGHSDDTQDIVSYHPQLIGDGFLRKTGLLLDGIVFF